MNEGQSIRFVTDVIKKCGDKISHKKFLTPHKVVYGRTVERKTEVEKIDEIIEYLTQQNIYSDGFVTGVNLYDEIECNEVVKKAYNIYEERKKANLKRSARRSKQTVIDLCFCNSYAHNNYFLLVYEKRALAIC